tara:strand:- start:65 stop:373 length:309 start_codon:yes stop_codon:yes gene_type:complete
VRVKTGDLVEIISGDDSGKQGKVLRVNPKSMQVIVEGVNFMKRHSKPTQQNQQGGIIEREAPIHISNLMVVVSGRRTRFGHRLLDNGRRIRVSQKTGEDIDS